VKSPRSVPASRRRSMPSAVSATPRGAHRGRSSSTSCSTTARCRSSRRLTPTTTCSGGRVNRRRPGRTVCKLWSMGGAGRPRLPQAGRRGHSTRACSARLSARAPPSGLHEPQTPTRSGYSSRTIAPASMRSGIRFRVCSITSQNWQRAPCWPPCCSSGCLSSAPSSPRSRAAGWRLCAR